MAIPEGYKTVEQIAVEANQTYNRVQRAIKELNIPQTVFAEDRRRRYYSPDAVEKIRVWLNENKI